jgi:hypothetical protein
MLARLFSKLSPSQSLKTKNMTDLCSQRHVVTRFLERKDSNILVKDVFDKCAVDPI